MSETLPKIQKELIRWSNPNIFKALARFSSSEPIAYRANDYQIEIEEHQYNSLSRVLSRLRKERAQREFRGDPPSSKIKYLSRVAVGAARSKLFPVNKGLITIRSLENPMASSLLPYVRYPSRSSRGNVYVYPDRNGLDLNDSDLLSIFQGVKSDKIENPYSYTDLELNVLANKHRQPIFNLQEMFDSQSERGKKVLRLGAYLFRLSGNEELESFKVSIPNLIGYQQEYSFEIFPTKYGPTISVVPEASMSINEVPFGDIDALRVPINDDFLVSLVQTHQ